MPFWYFFPVPQIPPEVAHQSNQVDLVKYLAKEGSSVQRGTPIALVENWWAVFQLRANGQGVLKKTFFEPGTTISVGDPIAIIGADGENIMYGQSHAVLEVVKMKREKPPQESRSQQVRDRATFRKCRFSGVGKFGNSIRFDTITSAAE